MILKNKYKHKPNIIIYIIMKPIQQKRGSGIQYGGGVAFNLYKQSLKALGVDTSGLMDGEFHAPMKQNGIWKTANFAGPGTNLAVRIKRGDKPLNEVDLISMAHDLRYTLSSTGDEVKYADNRMLNSLGKSSEHFLNKLPAKIGIAVKAGTEKLVGRTLYPTQEYLKNKKINPDDAEMYNQKLKELEQKGYGIDPSAFLKLKLAQTSRLPTYKNKIQPADGSESVSEIDYTQSEVEGDSNIDSEMDGSGVRLAGGLLPLLLLPFAGLISKVAVGAAVGVASGSASLGVWGIGEHNNPKNTARRIEKRAVRRMQRGDGVSEEVMKKIKKMKVKLTDFSQEALDKMSDFIREHATAKNAGNIAEFLKPFILEIVKMKLRAMGVNAMTGRGATEDAVMPTKEQGEKLVLDNVDFSKVQQAIEQEGNGLRLAGPKMSGYGMSEDTQEMTGEGTSAHKVIPMLLKNPELMDDRPYIKKVLLSARPRQSNIIIAFLKSHGYDY